MVRQLVVLLTSQQDLVAERIRQIRNKAIQHLKEENS
jgi:DNA-directed RNA polymerase sigma subunit (sigma70/sigma32)